VNDRDKHRREDDVCRRMRAMPDPLTMLRTMSIHAPDREAFVHLRCPDDIEPVIYNYARAAEVCGRFAAALAAQGVGSGATVAIIAPSFPETLLAIAGAMSVASVFPLNLLLFAEAMASQLTLAKARAVVTCGVHPAITLDGIVAQAVRSAGIELVVEIDAGHGRSDVLASSGARHYGGVTVAKEIELEDKFENMGAQMLRAVASKTHDHAGDGTTTATVLAQAIVREGMKSVAAGTNPMDLKRGIDLAVGKVVEDLKARSKAVSDNNEIAQVGIVWFLLFARPFNAPESRRWLSVRGQNIWRRLRRRLAEDRIRLGFNIKRRFPTIRLSALAFSGPTVERQYSQNLPSRRKDGHWGRAA
jgi:hypothetical protein